MNTADRSIKLLDAALRRRFAFIELMPDLELLRGAAAGELALDEFLEELNRRIARSEGREKQIGHAYLLDGGNPVGGNPVSEIEGCARCFREEILPLLQEYCYDEYGTLAKFIGSGLVDAEAQSLDQEKVADSEQLVAALVAEFGAEE
jgi:5-methylcytosine-specific restriction protein B